jgi:putative ABC transport system permease protein
MSGKHEAAHSRSHPRQTAAGTPPRTARLRLREAAGWRRLTGSASATAVAFCLLACACALVAVAGPRATTALRTDALRQLGKATPQLETAVVGTLDANTLATAAGQSVSQLQLHQAEAGLRRQMARTLPLAGPGSDWNGLTTPYSGFTDSSRAVGTDGTQLELAYRDTLSKNVRVVAGSLPSGTPSQGLVLKVPVAITEATASRFNLGVGSRIRLAGTAIELAVTGVVAPADTASVFWGLDPVVAAPVFVPPSGQKAPYWQGGAFVAAGALPALDQQFNPPEVQVTWMFGVALGHLTAAQAGRLAQVMPGTLTTAGQIEYPSTQSAADVTLTSGLLSLLTEFAAQNRAVSNVLSLMSVSLEVVGAAVLLLAAWLMAEKRRDDFAVLRARGASRRQLGIAALVGSGIAALPGAAAGIIAAVLLTPGAGAPLAWWFGGLTILVALAGPALITVRLHRGYAGTSRPDRPAGRMASVRRLIVECGLVLGSIGGLLVLRQQGVGLTSGDLYASAAPILIAVPVAIALLRLYPMLVRPPLLVASRRSGVTVFLGLARAARVSVTAVLPAFAMVLALSLVSFAGMVRGAVVRGEVAQSWQQAGAAAVISVPGAIGGAQQGDIAAVPGASRTALVSMTTATRGVSGPGITVIVASPRQYAALLAATPLPRAPASFADWHQGAAGGPTGTVPVLASAPLARLLGRAPVGVVLADFVSERVQVVGIAPAMSQVPGVGSAASGGFVVLPRSALSAVALAALPASALLVAGSGLNDRALTAAVTGWHLRGAQVILQSHLLTVLGQAALQHGALAELTVGGDAAAVGCLLVLLLTLMLSAQSRQMTLARATTMGMSSAQGRWLTLIEALPQIFSVVVGGLICALALVPLVGPTLELAVFTQSAASVPVRVEPLWLTVTAIGLLILAMATLTGQTALASRQAPRSLRIGG